MLSPFVNTTVCRLSFGILSIAIVGIVAVTIFVHPEKAELPMLVTLSGMITDVKPLQPEKAPLFNPVRTPYKIAA